MSLQTPVAFILFRRPETTARVWEKIREARPAKLFLIADGGRNEEEWEKCRAARKVVETIDWDCEVHRNFSDTNLGCRDRVVSGLDWVFEQVEEAIILEDDCLPSTSFFRFCEELLVRYDKQSKVMMISGNNFSKNAALTSKSYFFSIYSHIWGWATWRRAWMLHDDSMKEWPRFSQTKKWKACFRDRATRSYWKGILDRAYNGEWAWDHRWWFTCMQNGYAICPIVNLVTNIGFDSFGTHTKSIEDTKMEVSASAISFPLDHPDAIKRDFYLEVQASPAAKLKNNLPFCARVLSRIMKHLRSSHWWKFVRNANYRRVHNELHNLQKLADHGIKSSCLVLPSIAYTHGPTLVTLYEEIFIRELYYFNTKKLQPVILDAGANIGLATIFWKKIFPKAKITCFEPDLKATKCLKENIRNHYLKNIEVVKAALGCSNGFVNFDSRGGASGRISDAIEPDAHLQRVPQVRLRDYLNEPIDLLKLDVEGSESSILEDCADRLNFVSNLYIEYHSFKDTTPTLSRVLNILQNSGFDYTIESNVQRHRPLCARPDWDGITMALHIFAWRK